MENTLSSLDWSLVQSFLAVAQEGSLSAAARKSGQSQPTIGRHIKSLEAQFNVPLFKRVSRGYELTEVGQNLLRPAQEMHRAALNLNLSAAGQSTELTGTVRITASDLVAHHLLPPIIAKMRTEHPGILIDVVASNSSDNLLYREADIAVRMYRPTQLDVITRHLGGLAMGVYGAKSYFEEHGRPQTAEDLFQHAFVGYDRDDQIIRGMREMGWPATREMFQTRCDDQAVYWQLVCAGCGLGITQRSIGDQKIGVEQVVPDLPIPKLPVWLTAHEALRQTPRIRVIWDHLVAGLSVHLDH